MRSHGKAPLARLRGAVRRFGSAKAASVSMIFAFSLIPLILAFSIGLDYASAQQKQTKLQSVADAAALVSVNPYEMSQSTASAQTAALNMFAAQGTGVPGVNLALSDVSVAVNDTTSATGIVRVTNITYKASANNFFAGIVGFTTFALSGKSTATSSNSPNVDFYMLLDTSPSMAIAATQSGINTMTSNTHNQDGGNGCAFACHQANPGPDNLGNPNGWDNYALARYLKVALRIDLVTQATQNLMDTAQSAAGGNNAVYRVALYSFDVQTKMVNALTSNMTQSKTAAGGVQMLEVDHNNYLTASTGNNDEDTDWDTAVTTLNSAMPAPGSGTNNAGDKPQEVLFLVTDGVTDEQYGGGRVYNRMGGASCTTIKNRGIRIAILYTTYNPLPTNGWYNTYISPFQANIGPTLQACASAGLFFQVDTGGDISAAMNTLFQRALGSARLTT